MKKLDLIWLECGGCSGNIISFYNCKNPSFVVLMDKYYNLTFNNSHMIPFGNMAMETFYKTIENRNYILVIEGSLMTGENGLYNVIGEFNGKLVTGLEAAIEANEHSIFTIAVGTCASFGGISSSKPNLTNSKSVSDVLGNKVIRMPGCPCNGDWTSSLLYSLCIGDIPELDSLNRPIYLYGITIHDLCTRRSFFEKNIFAKSVGDLGCMLKIGCKGPYTKAPCPTIRWNGFINWPIGDSTPCIGCANEKFPFDRFFYTDGGGKSE